MYDKTDYHRALVRRLQLLSYIRNIANAVHLLQSPIILKTLRLLFTPLIFAHVCSLRAAEVPIEYANRIYEDPIRTVLFYQQSSNGNTPVISLGSGESLMLEFDEMKATNDFYMYTLIHCDANWQPSSINKFQTISGMGFENINDFFFSNSTTIQYTHYRMQVPGPQTQPRISGNYLLLVYRNHNEQDIVLTRRFMVLDVKGRLEVSTMPATQVQYRFKRQEVDFNFTVNPGYTIPNPYQDLKTQVWQNNNWESAIPLKPLFIMGNRYSFDYQEGNTFNGLNEFRFFDIRSLRRLSFNIREKYDEEGQKHAVVNFEPNRAFSTYVQYADFNGRMVIQNIDGTGSSLTESDYVWTHFTLQASEPLPNGQQVYVWGELSDWQLKDRMRMHWNEAKKAYECTALLKQAYYNYMYAVDKGDGLADATVFEGTHANTENTYQVAVYHRNQSMGYDELIAFENRSTLSGPR